jgi:hypothetical protein
LGDKFVNTDVVNDKVFKKFTEVEDLASEYTGKIIFKLKDPFEIPLKDFKSIYE